MKLQVLLATMNQKDFSLLDRINLHSDIIVCNQNKEKMDYIEFKHNGYNVRWYDFQEKGVGLNRNNALMRATGDVCLFADDDVIYNDDYEKVVLSTFKSNPDADVILFNINSEPGMKRFECKKKMRIGYLNCGKFGGVRIAIKRSSVVKKSISFNLLFGGGAIFSAGEDNMFIRDCIRHKLKVIAVPDYILRLDNGRESTWFKGYNDKFFRDLGSSYVYHYSIFAFPCAFIQLIRHKDTWLKNTSFKNALEKVREGICLFHNM